jgi:hypothetical protein
MKTMAARTIVAVALVLGAAPLALAQDASRAGDEAQLTSALEPGDRVALTMLDGATIKGRFVEIDAGTIRLRDERATRRVDLSGVDRVQRTRFGARLGALVGLGVGAGLGAWVASLELEGASALGEFVWIAGVSTCIGFSIDAALNLPRTVYRRQPELAVGAIAGPRAAGVGVRVAF